MKTIFVVAAVVCKNGKVLICSRPVDKPPAGWEFPGGKIEPGESDGAALRRELREELGVESLVLDQVAEIRHAYPEKHVTIRFYRTIFMAEPIPREGQQCRYLAPDELMAAGLLPADRPVAEFLAKTAK